MHKALPTLTCRIVPLRRGSFSQEVPLGIGTEIKGSDRFDGVEKYDIGTRVNQVHSLFGLNNFDSDSPCTRWIYHE